MKVDQAGLNLIKGFEGLRLRAYQDKAGVWTIGYGSTRYNDGRKVQPGDYLLNEACANDLLLLTLKEYENAVNSLVKVPINQNQYNALLSFTYNEGTGALEHSHLLVKLNAKDYSGAATEFLKWDLITNPTTHAKEVLDDLLKRRTLERNLFLKPI